MISYLDPFFKKYADRILLRHANTHLQYGQVWAEAMKRSKKMPPRRQIIMTHKNSCEHLVDLLASWKCDSEVISISPKRLDLLERLQVKKDKITELDVDADDKYCLSLYTSGSMGEGSRVRFTPENLIVNLQQISSVVDDKMISGNDRSYSILPWSHCYGLICELLFLITRGASLHLPVRTPRQDMSYYNPTILFTVPYMIDRIMENIPRIDPMWRLSYPLLKRYIFGRHLHSISIGGAPSDAPTMERFHKIFRDISVYQGYGMTEASPMIALNTRLNGSRDGSVGRLLPGIDGIMHDGELLFHGQNITLGLDPDRYTMHDGKQYLRSGDSGYYDKDGFLYITGRVHDHFKLSNGFYIHPDKIEKMFASSWRVPNVIRWVVVLHPINPSRLLMIGICTAIPQNKTIVPVLKDLRSYEIDVKYLTVQEAAPFMTEKGTPRRHLLSQYCKIWF